MNNKVMKQRNIPWLGAFTESLYTALPILSIINFLSIITVLYATVHLYLKQFAPWLTIWIFLAILAGITVLAMFIVYKFVVPSVWTFRGKQMFEFESEINNKIDELISIARNNIRGTDSKRIVAVAGGFDPIHPGHISYIEEAIKLGEVLVILSRDDQLIEKDRVAGNIKGRLPIPYKVRKAVIEWGLKGRGKVVENIDKDITSCQSLAKYKPNIFAKGGNTWDIDNLPEKEVCDKLGIKVVFGVGGFGKPYSSSQLGQGGNYD